MMGECTVFSLFVSSHIDWGRGGYPSQVWMVAGVGGVFQPGLDGGWGGGGVFQPGLDGGQGGGMFQAGLDGGQGRGGVPARSGWWPGRGGCSSQVWIMGWEGYLFQVWMVGGVLPQPGLDGGVLQPGLDGGVPPWARFAWWGIPPTMTGWGTPPNSKVSTCCMAGGMPLAFMQEDFLVVFILC